MDFPEGATNEERTIGWQEIAEVSDAVFGFNDPREKTNEIRFCVRVVLLNDKGEICVVKSEKYGYMQLPGGGIEKDESIFEALKRETMEETGWLISDIRPIGYTIEKREDKRNTRSWEKYVSYVFTAKPAKEVGTNYMEDEVAEGFKPIWIKLTDFITKQKQNEGHIESYSGCFSNRRDLSIAKFFKTTIQNNS